VALSKSQRSPVLQLANGPGEVTARFLPRGEGILAQTRPATNTIGSPRNARGLLRSPRIRVKSFGEDDPDGQGPPARNRGRMSPVYHATDRWATPVSAGGIRLRIGPAREFWAQAQFCPSFFFFSVFYFFLLNSNWNL
jgi:hypothetical protein